MNSLSEQFTCPTPVVNICICSTMNGLSLCVGVKDGAQCSLSNSRQQHHFHYIAEKFLAADSHSASPRQLTLLSPPSNSMTGVKGERVEHWQNHFFIWEVCEGEEAGDGQVGPTLSGFISQWHQRPSRCSFHYQCSTWHRGLDSAQPSYLKQLPLSQKRREKKKKKKQGGKILAC